MRFAMLDKVDLSNPAWETDLLGIVAGVGPIHGVERSFKLLDRTLVTDRLLISVSGAMAPTEESTFEQFAESLGLPEQSRESVRGEIASADWMHLGFERHLGTSVFKLYAERQAAFTEAIEQPCRVTKTPVLVHQAFSWELAAPGPVRRSRYLAWPDTSPSRVSDAVSRRFFPIGSATGAALLRIYKRARRAAGHDLFVLEVEEPGTPRRSIDVNLYPSGLQLDEIADLVGPLFESVGVASPVSASTATSASTSAQVGHVAGGISRNGHEFLTIYYRVPRSLAGLFDLGRPHLGAN